MFVALAFPMWGQEFGSLSRVSSWRMTKPHRQAEESTCPEAQSPGASEPVISQPVRHRHQLQPRRVCYAFSRPTGRLCSPLVHRCCRASRMGGVGRGSNGLRRRLDRLEHSLLWGVHHTHVPLSHSPYDTRGRPGHDSLLHFPEGRRDFMLLPPPQGELTSNKEAFLLLPPAPSFFPGPVASVICLHSHFTNLLRYNWHIINSAHLKVPNRIYFDLWIHLKNHRHNHGIKHISKSFFLVPL